MLLLLFLLLALHFLGLATGFFLLALHFLLLPLHLLLLATHLLLLLAAHLLLLLAAHLLLLLAAHLLLLLATHLLFLLATHLLLLLAAHFLLLLATHLLFLLATHLLFLLATGFFLLLAGHFLFLLTAHGLFLLATGFLLLLAGHFLFLLTARGFFLLHAGLLFLLAAGLFFFGLALHFLLLLLLGFLKFTRLLFVHGRFPTLSLFRRILTACSFFFGDPTTLRFGRLFIGQALLLLHRGTSPCLFRQALFFGKTPRLLILPRQFISLPDSLFIGHDLLTAGLLTAGLLTTGLLTAGLLTTGLLTTGLLTTGLLTTGLLTTGLLTTGLLTAGLLTAGLLTTGLRGTHTIRATTRAGSAGALISRNHRNSGPLTLSLGGLLATESFPECLHFAALVFHLIQASAVHARGPFRRFGILLSAPLLESLNPIGLHPTGCPHDFETVPLAMNALGAASGIPWRAQVGSEDPPVPSFDATGSKIRATDAGDRIHLHRPDRPRVVHMPSQRGVGRSAGHCLSLDVVEIGDPTGAGTQVGISVHRQAMTVDGLGEMNLFHEAEPGIGDAKFDIDIHPPVATAPGEGFGRKRGPAHVSPTLTPSHP